jgi:hypothetical protein
MWGGTLGTNPRQQWLTCHGVYTVTELGEFPELGLQQD